jgi:enamine deaminase RidA (YjgF/YER057c/UK114 family)
MTRQLISSERLHGGVPYHYAAAATGEVLVFTAGACPLDIAGSIVCPGDIQGQMLQALDNLRIALQAADCEPDDVVKTTVFVASSSREDLLAAWSGYERVYGIDGPPSTLLGVSMLGWPGQLVEIEAVAVRH